MTTEEDTHPGRFHKNGLGLTIHYVDRVLNGTLSALPAEGNLPEKNESGRYESENGVASLPSSPTNDATCPSDPSPSNNPTRPFRQPLTPSLSMNQGFKIPQLPAKKSSCVDEPISRPPRTPQPFNERQNVQKLRRWSSTTDAQLNRRNSFPYSRKDALEHIRSLRAEAKKGTNQPLSGRVSTANTSVRPRKGSGGTNSTTTGIDTTGYFNLKPNIPPSVDQRFRSTTTNGVLPTPSSMNESFHTIGTPLVTPRLEVRRRDTMRSKAENLPSTLWDYLKLELENFDIQGVEEYKKERLTNFLRIPETFEKVACPKKLANAVNLVWVVCLF